MKRATVVKWTRDDILYGLQVEQYLIGALGCTLTTLAGFIMLPIWAVFTKNYKIQNSEGRIPFVRCFLINFFGGVVIWIVAAAIFVFFKGQAA